MGMLNRPNIFCTKSTLLQLHNIVIMYFIYNQFWCTPGRYNVGVQKNFRSLRSPIFTQTFRRLCGGDGGKERCGGRQGEKERQNTFLPPPYTNPVYAPGEEGSLGNCSTPSSREISLPPQNSLKTLGRRIPSHTGCGRFEARYGKVITSVCFPIGFNHKSHHQ